jgi:transposase InsO family protein
MRYPASEKLEIIRLVEQSHLSARRTLQKLGIPRRPSTAGMIASLPAASTRWKIAVPAEPGLEPHPREPVRDQIIELALNEPELSPRELAVTFTDTKGYFVSEASVYRLLKAHDLITSPAFIVIKAADEFKDKTTAPNQLWQTDFTYLKVIGWGWFYLSTVLDDFSRYIIAWKLCTTMKAGDVTDTLTWRCRLQAATAPGCAHRPRLLVRQRPVLRRLRSGRMDPTTAWIMSAGARPSSDPGQDRALAPDAEEPHPARKLLPAGRSRAAGRGFVDHYNHRRYHESLDNLTPPTSTSGAATSSCWKGKGSNAKPSHSAACFIEKRPPKMTTLMGQSLR